MELYATGELKPQTRTIYFLDGKVLEKTPQSENFHLGCIALAEVGWPVLCLLREMWMFLLIVC